MERVLTETINKALVDGYYDEEKAWFTREQIGLALEYTDPIRQIAHIHNRHKERLDAYSRVVKMTTEVQTYNVYVYNFKGVMELCRWSKQPKADMVMDALYDMAEEVLKRGFFSLLSDEQLIDIITERQRRDSGTLARIDKTKIKNQVLAEHREKCQKELFDLWVRRFNNHEDVDMNEELKRICYPEAALLRKYREKWHKDESKEKRGGIVLF